MYPSLCPSTIIYVTVLHVSVHVDICIATTGDDRYGLGVDRFHRHGDVYMSLMFSL